MQKRKWISCLIISILYMTAVFCFTKLSYAVNDDQAIINILRGTFSGTPDGHTIYMYYPLSGFLKMLYAWNRNIEWYRIVMMGIYAYSIFLILYHLSIRFENRAAIAGSVFLGAVSLLWLTDICRFTYTTCGAFAAVSLILVYLLQTPEEENKTANLLSPVILFALTLTIRKECCFMAMPLLAAIWLYKNDGRRLVSFQRWKFPGVLFLCAAGILLLNVIAYSSKDWKAYSSYNKERTYLQDYGNYPSYEENKEAFENMNISPEEYSCIKNYRYLMLEDYSHETLHGIYLLAKSTETKKPFPQLLKSTGKRIINYYLGNKDDKITALKAASWILPFTLFALSLFSMIRRKISLKNVLYIWLLLAASLLLWVYIAYGGRFPSRVEKSLRILTVTASASGYIMLFSSARKNPFPDLKFSVSAVLTICVFLLSILGVWAGFSNVWEWPKQNTASNVSELAQYVSSHPENIYIKDTSSHITLSGDNVLSTGGWAALSPLYEDKLHSMGIENFDRNLLARKNVFLVAAKKMDVNKILGYSQEEVLSIDVAETFRINKKEINIYRVGH